MVMLSQRPPWIEGHQRAWLTEASHFRERLRGLGFERAIDRFDQELRCCNGDVRDAMRHLGPEFTMLMDDEQAARLNISRPMYLSPPGQDLRPVLMPAMPLSDPKRDLDFDVLVACDACGSTTRCRTVADVQAMRAVNNRVLFCDKCAPSPRVWQPMAVDPHDVSEGVYQLTSLEYFPACHIAECMRCNARYMRPAKGDEWTGLVLSLDRAYTATHDVCGGRIIFAGPAPAQTKAPPHASAKTATTAKTEETIMKENEPTKKPDDKAAQIVKDLTVLAEGAIAAAKTEMTMGGMLTLGKQTAKRSRSVVLAIAKKRWPAVIEMMPGFMVSDDDVALAIYAVLAGAAASSVPRITKSEARAKLLSYMRVWGFHVLSDAILDPFADKVGALLDEIVTEAFKDAKDESWK